MINHDIFSLDDPKFLEGFHERRAEKLEKDKKAYADKKGKVRKVVNALLGLRGKYGHESTHRFVSLSKDECGTYLQYKKIAGDPRMPKDLQGRRNRCLEWMNCLSPTASPHQSDDDGDGDGDSVEEVGFGEVGGNAVAAKELPGIAGGNDTEDGDCDEGGC